MTDFFDLGDDEQRVLDALRALLRETGLDPYLDLRTPDRASRAGGVLLVLNRAERLLEELRDLDEGVAAAGEWEAVVFKTDPDLLGLYKADARAPAVLADDASGRGATVMDRARDATRREAVVRALVSIGDLRRAVRIQG
nr:hypothetical protein [uncultured Brevundimonas sp.]